jgi:hypothetical protein
MGDKVGPHRDLLAGFPYLGPPHNVRRLRVDPFQTYATPGGGMDVRRQAMVSFRSENSQARRPRFF